MEHLEDLGVCRQILLKWNVKKWGGGGRDRISLARDRWWDVVTMVMRLPVRNFLTSCETLSS